MTTNRSVPQRIADTAQAFQALRDELTPQPLRDVITLLTTQKPDENTDVAAYASLVQSSLSLARLIAANDRAAMMSAAVITASGVRNVAWTPEDET